MSCLISDFVSINIIYSTLCKSGRKWYTEVIYNMFFDITCHANWETHLDPSFLENNVTHSIPFQPNLSNPQILKKTVCHPPELCQSRLRTSSWPWRSESAATCRKSPIRSQSCHFVSSNLAFSTLLSPSITLFVPGSAHQLYLGSPAAPASRNLRW